MPPEGIDLMAPKDILRYEEILRIANIAAKNGVTKIRLTGGEPLVRKNLLDFIRKISGIPGVDDLSLTTNGVLLKDFAEPLKDAGLKRINVSLDSLKRDRFAKMTRGDDLDKVLAGLEASLKAGLKPVKINVVVIKGFNDDEVLDFALLSKTKPYHVRFIEFMPFDTEAGWQKDKCLSVKEMKKMIEEQAGALEPVHYAAGGAGPARRFKFKDGDPAGEVGFISPVSEHFCGSCNRLRLTADGKLRTCLFSDNEIDLRTALRDGSGDDVIENLLFRAAAEKPERHHINENVFKKCSRTMSLIGG